MAHIDINDPIWDGVRDRLIAIGFKRGYEIGFKRGYEIGFKRGFEIGFKRGYAIGIRKTRDQIARNMLKDGLLKDFVSEITHLSAEEVDEIARSLDCGD